MIKYLQSIGLVGFFVFSHSGVRGTTATFRHVPVDVLLGHFD